MVRSASPDREHQSIFFSAEADAPAAIRSSIRLSGSYLMKAKTIFCKNFEQPICIKIVSSKDPLRRIESCMAPGLPANGR